MNNPLVTTQRGDKYSHVFNVVRGMCTRIYLHRCSDMMQVYRELFGKESIFVAARRKCQKFKQLRKLLGIQNHIFFWFVKFVHITVEKK